MTALSPLLPGQHEIDELPRFGLPQYMDRFPTETDNIAITVGGDVESSIVLEKALDDLPRVSQVSDFHCVTTWSKRELHWSGFRFADVYEQLIKPTARPRLDAKLVVFRGQDGYRVGMQLADLLKSDVLLADRLDDQPLSIANGAPLRLVAPAHYGYKNAKHVARIDFHSNQHVYRSPVYRFMDHPRARVAKEERGRFFPGLLLRWLYRPLISRTRRQFEAALRRHLNPNE